jgi:hypothetical protein
MVVYTQIPYTAQMCSETYHERNAFMIALRRVPSVRLLIWRITT